MAIQNPTSPRAGGSSSLLNVSAATVVKDSPGTLNTCAVNTAGTGTGAFHDCLTTGAANAANLVTTIADTVGTYDQHSFPFQVGIVFVPGTGMVASIAFS